MDGNIFYATDFTTSALDPGVMVGFNAQITVGASGKVYAWFNGHSIASEKGAVNARLLYDSNSPPTRGDAKRGVSCSRPIENSVPGQLVPFSLTGFCKDMPPGLVLWFDVNVMAEVITQGFNGDARVNNIQLVLFSP